MYDSKLPSQRLVNETNGVDLPAMLEVHGGQGSAIHPTRAF